MLLWLHGCLINISVMIHLTTTIALLNFLATAHVTVVILFADIT